MRAIGNFIWFILNGAIFGLLWWLIGILAYVSIIGIPWGKACFTMGSFMFFPFGKQAIGRRELTSAEDIGTGIFGTLGNIVWFLAIGIWLALSHLLSAIFCFISIIGIPFGIQHLKFAGIALSPIGKTIVSNELAAEVRLGNAKIELDNIRN